ncbi:MAG: hypothetical protein ACYS0I_20455 [Planctomycetota bacterium]|jgi:hypothetical protein
MGPKVNIYDDITLSQLEGIQRSITNRLKQLQKRVRQDDKEIILELIQLTRENLYRKAQVLCEERDTYRDKFQAICKILGK